MSGHDVAAALSFLVDWGAELHSDATCHEAIEVGRRITAAARSTLLRHRPEHGLLVLGFVNCWLSAVNVRPRLSTTRANQPVVVWTGGLWGHIGGQLMAYAREASRRDLLCDVCGRSPFVPGGDNREGVMRSFAVARSAGACSTGIAIDMHGTLGADLSVASSRLGVHSARLSEDGRAVPKDSSLF